MERFRDGLDGKLYERLNLLEPANFHELVNKAISQEDAMKKTHGDKKRMSGFASGSGTGKKFRFVKKNTPNPSQQSSTGRWTMKPSQGKPAGNFQFRNVSSRLQSLMHLLATLVIVVASTVVSRGITLVSVPSPDRSSPTPKIKEQEASLPLRLRSLWCKYTKAS
jgi:hypothetical protein